MDIHDTDPKKLLEELNNIGIALSAEKDHVHLLERILVSAKKMTNADGGTLYSRNMEDQLKFEIMHTDSLNIHMGGTDGDEIPFYPVKLYKDNGEPNKNNVAACAVLEKKTINIPDAYTSKEFDFSGTRNFDAKTGYRSRSFLTVPMVNHEDKIIGVLQLINARDKNGEVTDFSDIDQQLVESLASQAAVTITNKSLIDAQKQLFDALIKLIANAIDEKSPYTAGHCRRVPVLTNMIANAACKVQHGPLSDFFMTEEEKYELDVAAWLHDCGKITTPEYVVDKATKLETIYDKINVINSRFEIMIRDAQIRSLKRKMLESGISDLDDADLKKEIEQLRSDMEFIQNCNIGGEEIADETIERIGRIAGYQWKPVTGDKEEELLSDGDQENLKIGRGTLSYREREIINNHVAVTIKMLESLPYPEHLKRVPEYAGGHHEKMDGSGYPNKLKKDDMSIPARMVAIADIFEALTAKDRPYKKAMTLSKSLTILGRMKQDNHVDPDLFDVFMWDQVYLKYAKEHLDPEQIDDVDLDKIPGYTPPPA